MQSSHKSRNSILGKIKASLNEYQAAQPFPEVHGTPANNVFSKSDLSPEETFADAFIKLGGKFVYCENEKELIDNLFLLYESRDWQQLLCADNHIATICREHGINILQPADKKAEGADGCITACEMLVARTGSILFTSRQHMGRTAPVFYPVHIVIAYANQLVDDIDSSIAALSQKYGPELPSMINLNTGPSRTADIEKTLVVGVHGPGEVLCFYVNRNKY